LFPFGRCQKGKQAVRRVRTGELGIADFPWQEEKVTIKSSEKAVTFVTFLNNCLIVKRGESRSSDIKCYPTLSF
jgi:hypothetical protein